MCGNVYTILGGGYHEMIAGGWRVMNIDEAAAAESIAAEDPEASAVPGSNKKKLKKDKNVTMEDRVQQKQVAGWRRSGTRPLGIMIGVCL